MSIVVNNVVVLPAILPLISKRRLEPVNFSKALIEVFKSSLR
jgi:hypothetical protein